YYFKAKAKTSTATPQTQTVRDESRAGSRPGRTRQDVAEAYRATVAIGTCGAYRIFEEQHRGTFYGRLAEEYLNKNCAKKGEQTALATDKETPSPQPIPQPNSARPDTGASTGTGEKDGNRQIAVVAKQEEGAAPKPAASVEQEKVLETPPQDPGAMTASIQRELDRLGCRPGPVDGKWGRRTSQAIARFNSEVNKNYSSSGPSEDLLSALKEQTGTLCKTVATPAPPPTTRKTAAPGPRTAPPPKAVKKKKGPKEDQYWGGEDTRIECEVKGIWSSDCFKK
ncbi:MAG: peptidoglycan-binding protein, partial [Alphaproteobacteria bacterium]